MTKILARILGARPVHRLRRPGTKLSIIQRTSYFDAQAVLVFTTAHRAHDPYTCPRRFPGHCIRAPPRRREGAAPPGAAPPPPLPRRGAVARPARAGRNRGPDRDPLRARARGRPALVRVGADSDRVQSDVGHLFDQCWTAGFGQNINDITILLSEYNDNRPWPARDRPSLR